MCELTRQEVIGAKVHGIGHSKDSDPEWIVEGIGPAVFRSHYVTLDSGLVLDLFTAELSRAAPSDIEVKGVTVGIPVRELTGRTITAVACDDAGSILLILNDELYMRDANDGFTGNPLEAGRLADYTDEERAEFIDYWTEQPWPE